MASRKSKTRTVTVKKKRRRLTFSALHYSYNDHDMFLMVVPVDELSTCCRVSRAHEDPKRGYQRHLEPRRINQIADYLNGGNVIPGCLILSAEESSCFTFDKTKGTVSFIPADSAFLVIDGQHRLAGASASKVNAPMAACVFTGLDQEQEVQYFLDVNSNQKGVPRTLQLEIVKFLTEKDSPDDVRIRLFAALNERPDSPLAGRMSTTKSVLGKLSHVPFKGAVAPLFAHPPLSELKFDAKLRLILNFLKATSRVLEDVFGKDEKLSNAAFFQALFGAFPAVVATTRGRFDNLKEASFYAVLQPLGNVDWDRHSGTNKKAVAAFTDAIVNAVHGVPVSEDML